MRVARLEVCTSPLAPLSTLYELHSQGGEVHISKLIAVRAPEREGERGQIGVAQEKEREARESPEKRAETEMDEDERREVNRRRGGRQSPGRETPVTHTHTVRSV